MTNFPPLQGGHTTLPHNYVTLSSNDFGLLDIMGRREGDEVHKFTTAGPHLFSAFVSNYVNFFPKALMLIWKILLDGMYLQAHGFGV